MLDFLLKRNDQIPGSLQIAAEEVTELLQQLPRLFRLCPAEDGNRVDRGE